MRKAVKNMEREEEKSTTGWGTNVGGTRMWARNRREGASKTKLT